MVDYKRDVVRSPRLAGLPLRLFAELVESPAGGAVVAKLTHDSGLDRFRTTSPGTHSPIGPRLAEAGSSEVRSKDLDALAHLVKGTTDGLSADGYRPATVEAFATAYRENVVTPSEVAGRVLEAMEKLDRGEDRLGIFIASHREDLLAQAQASTKRLREGKPLSILDGVPVAVKDEVDMRPYPTTLGTRFLGREAVREDATVVRRLREAGALLLGKVNMHEVGIATTGVNPHHGAARNPYDPSRMTGGSSSASASAVAAGFCPVSIGADGGGSIRIPAGLCGVVGLKATYGRISEHGVGPLCWSVGHVGPLGATARDVAVAYAAMAGVDEADPATLGQPHPRLDRLSVKGFEGLRIGVPRAHFEDAEAVVVRRCDALVSALVDAGAVRVEIPSPDMNTVLWCHTILILSEMASALRGHLQEDRRRFGLDVRINLAIAERFGGNDYVHALRHQQKLIHEHLELMNKVDVIVTPTTACTAPPIRPDALADGESDLATVDGLMRFIRVGNLTGFPAIAVPAGYDDAGLPVSCQFMARPWEEELLLRIALFADGRVPRRKPLRVAELLR